MKTNSSEVYMGAWSIRFTDYLGASVSFCQFSGCFKAGQFERLGDGRRKRTGTTFSIPIVDFGQWAGKRRRKAAPCGTGGDWSDGRLLVECDGERFKWCSKKVEITNGCNIHY